VQGILRPRMYNIFPAHLWYQLTDPKAAGVLERRPRSGLISERKSLISVARTNRYRASPVEPKVARNYANNSFAIDLAIFNDAIARYARRAR